MNAQENEQQVPEWSKPLEQIVSVMTAIVDTMAGLPPRTPKPEEPQLSDSEKLANQIYEGTAELTGKPAQQAEPAPAETDGDDTSIFVSQIQKGAKINR